MPEIQPSAGPQPPPYYAAYPRDFQATYGTSDRLQALCDGYYGLGLAFLVSVLAALLLLLLLSEWMPVWGLLFILCGALIAHPPSQKVAVGMGWPPSAAWVPAILIGFTGILGYAVLQGIAESEIKRYGLRRGSFGYRKRAFEEAIAKLRGAEEASPAPGMPFQG